MRKHQNLLAIGRDAAERAAAFIRTADRPGDPSAWGRKGLSDFVTEVDREAERIIGDRLRAGAPGSAVLGEELSPECAGDHLVWVVDPLDGTTNYLHRFPAYAVSIALLVDGELCAGVVVDVTRERVYTATRDGGAWCDQAPMHVSAVDRPRDALIGTGFPFKIPHRLPTYLRQFTTILPATSGVRRGGSAALDLVDVALGRLDGFWELALAPWDVAAGTLLVREAGGVVTDLEGSAEVIGHGPIVAGNREMHQWLLGALAR